MGVPFVVMVEIVVVEMEIADDSLLLGRCLLDDSFCEGLCYL